MKALKVSLLVAALMAAGSAFGKSYSGLDKSSKGHNSQAECKYQAKNKLMDTPSYKVEQQVAQLTGNKEIQKRYEKTGHGTAR